MPKKMEKELRREADTHKGWSKERKDAYVYGAMRKAGWTPARSSKGKK